MWPDFEGLIVKTCGIQDTLSAKYAVDAGADLIGIICVPNKKRTISKETAIQISNIVHDSKSKSTKLVGVFCNQPKEEVLQISQLYNLDIVQLHGKEPWKEYYHYIGKPIIKKLDFPQDCDQMVEICQSASEGYHILPLFDSQAGGSGEKLDWHSISAWVQQQQDSNIQFLLAGGLDPNNVEQATKIPGVVGVDVSSGIESSGRTKDFGKITKFVNNARV